jgi:hypothetical protein
MRKLDDKVAIVTGVGRGLGAKVAVTDLDLKILPGV